MEYAKTDDHEYFDGDDYDYEDDEYNYDDAEADDNDYDSDDEIKRAIAMAEYKKKKRQEKAQANLRKKSSLGEFLKEHSGFYATKITSFLDLRSICALQSTSKAIRLRIEPVWSSLLRRDFPSIKVSEANANTQLSRALNKKYFMNYVKNHSEKFIGDKLLDQYQFFNTLGEWIRDEERAKTLYWKNVIEIIPKEDLEQNIHGKMTLLSHDVKTNIVSMWVAEPLLCPKFRFEHQLKNEILVSCEAVAGLFALTTSIDTEEASIRALYIFDPEYKVNYASKLRQAFSLKIQFEFQKDKEGGDDGEEVKRDSNGSKKPVISDPIRKENEISFELFAKEPEICSMQYHPEKKLLVFFEKSSDTLIIGDLNTYSFKTFPNTPLRQEFTFNFHPQNSTWIIAYDVKKLIFLNTVKNCIVFEHLLDELRECFFLNLKSRDLVICYSSTTAQIIDCETLEIIDQVNLPLSSQRRFFQLLQTENMFCMVMTHYENYKPKFAILYCKLEHLDLQLAKQEPSQYINSIVSVVRGPSCNFSFFSDNTLLFFQANLNSCWISLIDIATLTEVFNLPVSFKSFKSRESEIKVSNGVVLLISKKNQDYYSRRVMMIFPTAKFCYPAKCKRTSAVYSDDSEKEEEESKKINKKKTK